LAGMDGNRTHPGRLNSAPQTVLKTALLTSVGVHRRAPKIESGVLPSVDGCGRPPLCGSLAVYLAVSARDRDHDRAGGAPHRLPVSRPPNLCHDVLKLFQLNPIGCLTRTWKCTPTADQTTGWPVSMIVQARDRAG
jgi:hypothetical protein